jgi:hypothetical protein
MIELYFKKFIRWWHQFCLRVLLTGARQNLLICTKIKTLNSVGFGGLIQICSCIYDYYV